MRTRVILKCFSRIHAQFRNTKLYLVGDGPCHDQLCKQVSDMNLKEAVIMPGMVNNVEYYYAISDAYVQSSHREALPLSVLEAMAAGLPIISTNVGGLKDVICGNGYLVNDNEEDGLYNAMLSLLSLSESQMEIMKKRSLEIVSDYSSEKMASDYCNIYYDIIKRGSIK